MAMIEVTWQPSKFWLAGRPLTGFYAFLLTIASFVVRGEDALWGVSILAGVVFWGLTMSIMLFNDWVDREHDLKKGKSFANEHADELIRYWVRLSSVTAMALVVLSWYSVPVASLCAMVWIVGVLYSYIPHWYLVQNIIVALCSGAPALVGSCYRGDITHEALSFSRCSFPLSSFEKSTKTSRMRRLTLVTRRRCLCVWGTPLQLIGCSGCTFSRHSVWPFIPTLG